MAAVSLHRVSKAFGKVPAVRGVNLDIAAGEFCCFVGPSGCGKSTLLRLIAGLEDISSGEIRIDGQPVNGRPPAQRGVAMVFQSYALYPHMTVYQNMAFGLQQSKASRQAIQERVEETARLLQIESLLERLPKQLSGGQRQRVAIGRAIVRQPRVFLFDEPLSNLDAGLRQQTRVEIARLHARLQATMIYVTHDQIEAMTLADKIVVLREGRVEQVGPPLQLYHHPANRFVAGFIGSPQMNFLPARLRRAATPAGLALPGGETLEAAVDASTLPTGGAVTCGIRPEHVELTRPQEAALCGTVVLREQLGDHSLVFLRIDGVEGLLAAKLAPGTEPAAEQQVGVLLPPRHCHLFDTDGRACPRSMVGS
jgi:multiple sugar transport system ATP-binding protein